MARLGNKKWCALMLAVLPSLSFALGLGDVVVHSALNQPLTADIEVIGLAELPREQITFKIASNDMFAKAGLNRPFYLNRIRFSWQTENANKPYIRMSTFESIKDPYINFLIEVKWPNGQIIREYTILLDPPLYDGAKASTSAPVIQAQVSKPAVKTKPAPVKTATFSQEPDPFELYEPQVMRIDPLPEPRIENLETWQPPPAKPRAKVNFKAQPKVQRTNRPQITSTHLTKKGDSLWGIASKSRPNRSMPIQTMVQAIFKNNPHAFANNNINGLMAGMRLQIPMGDTLEQLTQTESERFVARQNKSWANPVAKKSLAPTAVAAKPMIVHQKAVAPKAEKPKPLVKVPTEIIKPTEKPIAKKPATQTKTAEKPKDHLKLIVPDNGGEQDAEKALAKTRNTAGVVSALKQELLMSSEALDTARRQNEMLQEELKLFSEQIKSLRALVEIKKAEIAEMKEGLASKNVIPVPMSALPKAKPATKIETPKATKESARPPDKTAALEIKTTSSPPGQALPKGDSLIELLLNQRLSLLAIVIGGLGLALLIALAIYKKWRQISARNEQLALDEEMETDPLFGDVVHKEREDEHNEEEALAEIREAEPAEEPEEPEEPEEALVAAKNETNHEELVSQTAEHMEQIEYNTEEKDLSNLVKESISAHEVEVTHEVGEAQETEEEVMELDPIAEAEKYMAKRRYVDAQELLQLAIRGAPHNYQIHIHLLQVLAINNEQKLFDEVLVQIKEDYRRTHQEDWIHVLKLREQEWPDKPLPADIIEMAGDKSETITEEMTVTEEPVVAEAIEEITAKEPRTEEKTTVIEGVEHDAKHVIEFEVTMPELASESEVIEQPKDEDVDGQFSEAELALHELKKEEQATKKAQQAEEAKKAAAAKEAEAAKKAAAAKEAEAAKKAAAAKEAEAAKKAAAAKEAEEQARQETGVITAQVSELPIRNNQTRTDDSDLKETGLFNSEDDDVTIKIKLAKAYLEMGDPVGARDILEEVLSEGDTSQKDAAQTILKDLDQAS